MPFSQDPIHTLQSLVAKNKTKSVSLYLVVTLVLAGVMACLPIIKIDISSQSRGIVRPKQENAQLQTIVNGEIVYTNLKLNQIVSKGDTLLIIKKNVLESQLSLNDSLLEHAKEELLDFENIFNNQIDKLKEENIIEDYNRFLLEKRELYSKVQKATINYNRYKHLFDKQVISQAEFETHSYNLKFAKEALSSFEKKQQAQWKSQKHELETQIKNMESRKEQFIAESNNYVLTAPLSGTIENMVGLPVGTFINASQTVCTISPNTNMIVENIVSPNDIGLIKIGQSVKFQFDAFNYNQWGMLEGKVIEIDNNITTQDNSAFFKVRCSLNSNELELKNGYKTIVSKGMTLTSRYFITRRSLFDLLFDKIDDWFNPKTITKN